MGGAVVGCEEAELVSRLLLESDLIPRFARAEAAPGRGLGPAASCGELSWQKEPLEKEK